MWFLSLIPFLGRLIDPISKITGQILDLQAKKVNATTEQEKNRLAAQISVLEVQRDVLVSEDPFQRRVTAFARAAFVFPVAVYIWKLFLWDKVLALGETDDLSPNLWWIVFTVISFYFLQNITAGMATILKR